MTFKTTSTQWVHVRCLGRSTMLNMSIRLCGFPGCPDLDLKTLRACALRAVGEFMGVGIVS